MKDKYRDGLAELDIILEYADDKSLASIPKSFRKFISENKSKHTINIDPEKSLEEQNLLYETKVILSQLYINYWCSKEEREVLIKKEKEQLDKAEKEKREKYSYDNLFKNRKTEIKSDNYSKELLIIDENWITKIINKLKRFFKIAINKE